MKVAIKIYANEKGGYTAVCPSLPGCRGLGHTQREAQERLDEAIRGYVAAMSNFVPEQVQHDLVEV